jgi:erythrocyte membrane protein band 4.1
MATEHEESGGDTTTTPLSGQGQVPESKKSRGGVHIRILLLDGSEFEPLLQKTATGRQLVDSVCEHLNLAEKDYFSLSYRDSHNVRQWIHDERPISKVGKKARPNWVFNFEVKFYPLDPVTLNEDYTRYLIFLQTRVDIVNGKLPASFLALALLGSYAVQSDLGDYNQSEHGTGCEYIKDIKFASKQTDELLEKIAELHATHRGQRPDEAELNYLENAEKLALYGMHMHPAKDIENGDVSIGVGAIGLVVYKEQLRIHRFPWAKIMKIAYKRNTFTIKIRPEIPNDPQRVLDYKLGSNILAKRLWRIAVEHHGFFRLKEPDPAQRAQFPHFGSKFRYSGRTQYQARGSNDAPGRIVPKVNRKASTRFIGARATNIQTGTGGFSTDRAEQYHMDAPRVATLDLKNRNRSGASTPTAEYGDDSRNLSVIDPGGSYGGNVDGHVAVTGASVAYSKQGYQTGAAYDQYGNPIHDTSTDFSSAENTLTARYPTGSMDRREPGYGTGKYSTDGEDSLRFQEDQRLLRGQAGAVGGQWGAGGGFTSTTTTKTKTSTRTYTDSDGTVITEYITEKDGVIEKRIEKRSMKVTTNGGEDVDYDKALLEAIQSVTNMDQDLSVEKIEIHTKSET